MWSCAAINRSPPTQAAAANAPEAFKKLRREENVIREFSSRRLLALDGFCGCVPRSHIFMEVRMVSHMACNSRVVAENLILDNVIACHHGLKEIRKMIRGVVISLRRRKSLGQRQRGRSLGMRSMPVAQILLFRLGSPPVQGVPLRLWPGVLGNHGNRVVINRHRGLLTV